MPVELLNKFGLSERDIKTCTSIFEKYPAVEKVCIFGSRAQNRHKQGSDIDLAIMNDGISAKTVREIQSEFEESSLPYRIDLINYPELEHDQLIDHIDRLGIPFYTKA